MPELLRVREAAKLVGVAPTHLWDAIRAGDLPAYQPGSTRLRVLLRDVEAWVETKRVKCDDVTS